MGEERLNRLCGKSLARIATGSPPLLVVITFVHVLRVYSCPSHLCQHRP